MIDESALLETLASSKFWRQYLLKALGGDARIHLGVFLEPFLGAVLRGAKTVESRFSLKALPPYARVSPGDVLLLKKAGGPVVGICRVQDAWCYVLDRASWTEIRQRFEQSLCLGSSDFLEKRRNATFATLMRLDQVLAFPPIPVMKRDRRGWVIVRDVPASLSLPLT
jgi:hypothetical protein